MNNKNFIIKFKQSENTYSIPFKKLIKFPNSYFIANEHFTEKLECELDICTYEDFNEITNENLSVDEIFGDEEDEIFLCDTEESETLQEEFLIQQEPEEEEEEEEGDEYIQSQFKIDEDKSFYLIDFEGSTALVGQIGEEIFALKRFEDPIKGALQVRLNEKKGIISPFMVKADKFKALVEVSPESMNLLIEL